MKTYPLFKVHVDAPEALSRISKVFSSGFINEGTEVTQLTTELSEYLAAQNLILVNSCTSALTLALHLAGAGPNTEVVSTPMTCVATNTAITSLGTDIVWADIDPHSGMIDPADVAGKISDKTVAVMAVAWAGTPPDLRALMEICNEKRVKLILDAAHAFDATYEGRPIHDFADFTCYSFQAIKHFTTGDGGALVCFDHADHLRSKALKWFGLDRDAAKDEKGNWKGQQWDVDIEEAGYKFNMNNVSAAIGLSQMDTIENNVGLHRFHARVYDHAFRDFKPVQAARRPGWAGSSFWVYTMKIYPEYSRLNRDELLTTLNSEGIMAGVVHVPNDDYACFRQYQTSLPGVREFSSNQFSLPCGWWLNEDDVIHIARRVKELTQ